MSSKPAEQFKILGEETRIRIIELLKRKGPQCVSKLSQVLGITCSAVSQHLKILKQANLVCKERKGYWIHYRIDPTALERCGDMLSQVCSCGCIDRDKNRAVSAPKGKSELARLRKYERDLKAELDKVRSLLTALEEKK